MWSRMQMMSIIKWCMFSGGCSSRKEHATMQWVDIDFIAFSFLARKNTTFNNIITISDVHDSQIKTNIDVANEVNYM